MIMSAPQVVRPALVFVHGSWEDRIAARLAGTGMRVDSIRSAMSHNSTCRLELYVQRLGPDGSDRAPGTDLMDLAFRAPPGPPPRQLRMPSGSVIRAYEGETLDRVCERQAASDFRGVLGLPPFLWQGDLPGLGSGGAMFVRDLGPERNARILEGFPAREPRVLMRRDGEVLFVPYDRGMMELWSNGEG
jgi:hypothetical protein